MSGVALKQSCGPVCLDDEAQSQQLTQEPRRILARYDDGSVTGALSHARPLPVKAQVNEPEFISPITGVLLRFFTYRGVQVLNRD
jgi:hypothetical protein